MRDAAPSLSIQRKLIDRALKTEEPFEEVLASAGWTYDDLIYVDSRTRSWDGSQPAAIEDFEPAGREIPLVSFFTGCGGMDLGLEAVGFKNVSSFEINEVFCKTLRRNRSDWKVFGPPTHSGDVSKFAEMTSALRGIVDDPFDGIFVGGPPCQPFSIAANQRFSKNGENFKRVGFDSEESGSLFLDFVRLIVAFKPRAFLIENVTGLRDIDGGRQLSSAMRQLHKAGYEVEDPFVLNAADFGVPQKRRRLFVVGSRVAGQFQKPQCSDPPIGAGSVFGKEFRGVANHDTRRHMAASVERYMRLGYGQRDALGRVDRLDPTSPSKTVIAGGTKGGGRSHLHPEIPRTLTVRECARLQTFPDNFEFMGSPARQFTQVGNAVPPVLASRIGQALIESYF